MDRYSKRLLWQGGGEACKIDLVKWDIVCLPKSQGGLGVLDLAVMNKSLLSNWVWKLENSSRLWQKNCGGKILKGDRSPLLRKSRMTPFSGKAFFGLKRFFTNIVKSPLVMVLTLAFGKIFGVMIVLWLKVSKDCLFYLTTKTLASGTSYSPTSLTLLLG